MLRGLLLALAGLLLAAAPAAATVAASTTDGAIVLSGAGGGTVQLYMSADRTQVVVDGSGATGDGVGCVASTESSTAILCAARPTLQASFDGADDSISLSDVCFASGTIALGEGTNRFEGATAACPGSALNVSGGGGADNLQGAFDAGAVTAETLVGLGGDDRLSGGGGDDAVSGGPGNDALSGAAGNDRVLGEEGSDKLEGSAGNDVIDGGPGDDQIGNLSLTGDDDQGADDVRGGPGNDLVDFFGHTGGMALSLNDLQDDGSPGEGDNVHSDLERVVGSGGADTFVGTPGPDDFDGGSGADVARGGDGNDTLKGNSDADQLFGEGGADTLTGLAGDDVVDGGAGTDSLFGDADICTQRFCPAGNDQLRTRDGEVDQVNCGGGADIATIDAGDVAAVDGFQACEKIDRPVPVVPGGPGVKPVQPFTFTTTGRLTRSKGVRVKITCPGPCSYTAAVAIGKTTARRARLGKKARTIGSVKGSLLKAGSKTVTVKFSKRIRSRMKRSKTVTATLKLAVKDANGKTARRQKELRLRR